MGRFTEFIKEHPIPAAVGGVVLFIIFYVLLSGRKQTTVAVPVQTGPSDATLQAQIAASTQQYAINADAQKSANQLQAEYNAQIVHEQTGLQAALIAAQAANLQTTTAGDIAMRQTQAQTDIANIQTSGQIALERLATSTSAEINSQNQQTQQLQITSARQNAADQLHAEESIYNTGAALQSDLAQTAASVLNTQTSADLSKFLAGIGLQDHANVLNAGIDQTLAADQFNLNSQYLTGTFDAQARVDAAHLTQLDNINNLIASGALNKGGAGGANQVAALQAELTGSSPNPYAPITAQYSQGGIITQLAGLFSSIGRGVAGGLSAA